MLKSLTKAFVLASFVALTACATPIAHNTPSGKAEAFFYAQPDKIKPEIVNLMVNHGFNISKDTPYLIAFDKPSDNIMANVLLGSKYDAQPNIRATFTFAPNGVNTRVILDYAMVTNPGSAFERITPVNGNVDTQTLQTELDRISVTLKP